MNTKLLQLILISTLVTLSFGCKQVSNLQTNSDWIHSINITNSDSKIDFTTTFTNNLEADIQGEFPIGDDGSLLFFNDDSGRFNISINSNQTLLSSPSFTEVTALPNGMQFPDIVTGPLMQKEISSSNLKYKLYIIYSKKHKSNRSKRLVGLIFEMNNIRANFPKVEITQSYFNEGKKFASFTLYGPHELNGKTLPGGLLLIGELGEKIAGSKFISSSPPAIHGQEASKFQTVDAKLHLIKRVHKVLSENGIYLNFF